MKREDKEDTNFFDSFMSRKKKRMGGRFPILDPYLVCFYMISYFW